MFGLIDYAYWFFKSRKKDFMIGDEKVARSVTNQEGDETWVCFLPWRNTFDESRKHHLLPTTGLVVAYEGPVSLVGTDALETKKSLVNLVDNFDKFFNENGTLRDNMNVLGISVGNLPAFYIANRFNARRLVSICPGARLGENIYRGIATQEVRKRAEERYPSHEDYDEILEGMNPIDNISNLPKGEIYVELGGYDKYIPTSSGEELIKAMVEAGKNPKVKRNRFSGHVSTIRDWGKRNKSGSLDYFK